MINAEKALEEIRDGNVVGLGSGHAAEQFIRTLGDRVRAGLRVRGVPTSEGSAALARSVGIPLVSLAEGMPIDVTVDGADEVDPHLNLLKGWGRALVREKIVAASSRRLVIVIGPEHVKEKLVARLGQRGKLPIEVVPFGLPLCLKRLADLGLAAEPLRDGERLFLSDNGNNILECRVSPIDDPQTLESHIRAIPGVVGTGLFLGMADLVLIQDGDRLEVRTRKDEG
jgi:ribose 5-phosphate isomerase A